MKKLKISKLIGKIFGVSMILIMLFVYSDANAQRRKSYLKKKNRRISTYKGGSIHFDKNKRYIIGGISLNAMNYFGDLAPKSQITSTDLSFTRPSIGLYLGYRYTPNLTLRASLSWGRLRGGDFESADPEDSESGVFRYVRNLHFRNDIKELAIVGQYDLYGNHGTFLNRVDFTPYIFAGVAVFHHNPKAMAPDVDKTGAALPEAGQWVALRPLGTEGQNSEHYNVDPYGTIQVSIPFGIGARVRLDKRFDFEFEIGYRYLFTDYIDDVSGMYVDLGALDSELARAMSDRSNETNDVISGESRDLNNIIGTRREVYTSRFNGETYRVVPGYGSDNHPDNNRGFSTDKDIYIVTSFKLTYVLTGSFSRAKYR